MSSYANLLSKKREYNNRKRNATPKWVNPEDLKKIYDECKSHSKATGVPHHVDHIYPLKHEDFCGLHVPANLRIVSASENIKKHNHPPETELIHKLISPDVGCQEEG